MSTKLELLKEFMATMTNVHKVMSQLSSASFEDKVASMLQMQALSFLNNKPNSTVGELAETLNMSSSSVAQFTDRLVKARLVTRKLDPADRRIVRLSLTKVGKSELNKIQDELIVKTSELLSYISDKDLKEMIQINKRLLNNFKAKQKIQ